MNDGDRWVNDTGRFQYQCISSLRNPCAVCLARHGSIGPGPWPQAHPHCGCESIPIPPGYAAPLPVDEPPAEVLARVWPEALPELLGADLAELVRAGLVGFDEAVDDDWDFAGAAELVRRLGLTRARMVGAGISPATADRLAGGGGG